MFRKMHIDYLVKGLDHQKASTISKKECKFVTVILFGTMSESFREIVRKVFELSALVWGWRRQGCGT